MRTHVAFAAVLAALVFAVSPLFFAFPGSAAGEPDRLYVTIEPTTVSGANVFVRNEIRVGQVPVLINVTVRNTDPGALDHTFTIRAPGASPGEYLVNTGLIGAGETGYAEFLLLSGTQIEIAGQPQTVETDGGALRFFCIPHEGAGMFGTVVLGSAAEIVEPPEKGVFLRAYWIGLLGFGGTILLIVISYFVIKGSSRHYVDHSEHVRRGGP